MVSIKNHIFGNSVWHARFHSTTEILAALVLSAPNAVDMAQLQSTIRYFYCEVKEICSSLERIGLVRQDPETAGKWSLACDPCMVTLEDVFLCLLTEEQGHSPSSAVVAPGHDGSSDIDLLVMQAMITINESIRGHLRRFSLDRLKASAAGMLPMPRRRLGYASLDNDFRLSEHDRGTNMASADMPVFLEL